MINLKDNNAPNIVYMAIYSQYRLIWYIYMFLNLEKIGWFIHFLQNCPDIPSKKAWYPRSQDPAETHYIGNLMKCYTHFL